jgi:diacylglycerol kinase family enzyme
MESQIEIIINAGSGYGDKDEIQKYLAEIFKTNGTKAHFSVARSGEEFLEITKQIARSDCQTIVAAGGDGTISTIAAEIIGTEKTLGVLPLGTLNHFAKDLQIPLDLAEAARVIVRGRTARVDVGEINRRIFINNSSIGLYPRIVRRRRQQQERLGRGKWFAFFWAALTIFRRYPFLNVKLEIKDQALERRTPFVFVGNNEYEMHILNIGGRRRLDEGRLCVYLLHRTGRMGLLLLALRSLFGRLREARDFDEFLTEEVRIEKRRKRVLVALDGEITLMNTPLHYRIRPQALRVIVPN